MKKEKCQSCGSVEKLYPIEKVLDHVKGHTRSLYVWEGKLKKKLLERVCTFCYHEIFLDSQWSVGFEERRNFLAGLEFRYTDFEDIVQAGYVSLSLMCPLCNGTNTDHEEEKDGNTIAKYPHLWKLNKDIVQNIWRNERDWPYIFCLKCTEKIEKSIVDKLSPENLILNLRSFYTVGAQERVSQRLRGL